MSSRIDIQAAAISSGELLRRLRRKGCIVERQVGSHYFVRCGNCVATIPMHAGRDLAPGTLAAIRRALAPCVGTEVFR